MYFSRLIHVYLLIKKSWSTASHYMLVHGAALVAINAHPAFRAKKIASYLISLGILLFSGSIYGLVLTKAKILGPVTPVGGTLILAGWAALLI